MNVEERIIDLVSEQNGIKTRIEKLERDRDAMVNWGRQFDFIDKHAFKTIKLFFKSKEDKPTFPFTSHIAEQYGIKPKDSEPFWILKKIGDHLINRTYYNLRTSEYISIKKEIERLKSTILGFIEDCVIHGYPIEQEEAIEFNKEILEGKST